MAERVARTRYVRVPRPSGSFTAQIGRPANLSNWRIGGSGEIRTHGGIATTPVFKTGALNHSATLPSKGAKDTRKLGV
jgi:hypothetical protein